MDLVLYQDVPTKHPTNDAFAKRLALLEKGLIKDKQPWLHD